MESRNTVPSLEKDHLADVDLKKMQRRDRELQLTEKRIMMKTQELVGETRMAEEPVKSSLTVQQTKRKMELSAILNVKLTTMELAQYAGKIVHLDLEMMVLSVANQVHMEEERDLSQKAVARRELAKDVRSGVYYGIQNVKLDSIMLHVVCAHQTVSME